LSERLPRLLENADARGDVYEATDIRIRIAHAQLLAAGRAADASAELERAIAEWPRDRFYLQHWWHMIASVDISLYANDARAAWATIAEAWPPLRRSFLLRVQYIRVESLYHRACAALAMGTRSQVRLAAADARRLQRENAAWARPLGEAVRAGVAAARGQLAEAVVALESAEAGFHAADMTMYADAARRCRGELVGGDHGRALVSEAEARIRGQGVADPASMAAILIPVRHCGELTSRTSAATRRRLL
jgi:hypothetical protein